MLDCFGRKRSRGFRNLTMILLLFDNGTRLSELINLKVSDIDFIYSCILGIRKGNRERVVPFGSQG